MFTNPPIRQIKFPAKFSGYMVVKFIMAFGSPESAGIPRLAHIAFTVKGNPQYDIMYYIYLGFISLPNIYTYSLEWDEIQWRDIGDEGAIALADPRVFKNFKTLK